MLFNLLVLFSFLVVLLQLRRLVNILPSLLACIIRGKENLNLEASVKLSRDRDLLALAMIVPFCLVSVRYKLYYPGFLHGMSPESLLGIYFGIFFAYTFLRVALMWLFRPKRMSKKTYSASHKASYSFFIIYTLVLLAIGAVMGVLDSSDAEIKNAMLWVSVSIYALFLIRKTQIFSTSCSIFMAFLYLCALEILPTGILVVSAMIF